MNKPYKAEIQICCDDKSYTNLFTLFRTQQLFENSVTAHKWLKANLDYFTIAMKFYRDIVDESIESSNDLYIIRESKIKEKFKTKFSEETFWSLSSPIAFGDVYIYAELSNDLDDEYYYAKRKSIKFDVVKKFNYWDVLFIDEKNEKKLQKAGKLK